MEFGNSKNNSGIQTLSSIEIYRDKSKQFLGKALLIGGQPYCGISKSYYNKEAGKYIPIKDKCVYLPAQAWKTFVNDIAPVLSTSIEPEPVQAPQQHQPLPLANLSFTSTSTFIPNQEPGVTKWTHPPAKRACGTSFSTNRPLPLPKPKFHQGTLTFISDVILL